MFGFVVVVLLLFRCCLLGVCVCLCVALALLMRVSFDQFVFDVLFHCSCNAVDVSSFVVRVVYVFVLLSCSCFVVELLLFVVCLCVVFVFLLFVYCG